MAIKLTVMNQRYDDVVPAYFPMGDYYFCRLDGQLYDKSAFDAMLTSRGLSFGAGEMGVPSAAYLAGHIGLPGTPSNPAPVTLHEIHVTVTKSPTAVTDDHGEITVTGGPADKAYTVTVTTKDKTSAGDDVQNVAVAALDTAAKAATAIGAAISDPNVTVTVSGVVIDVSPKTGSTIEKLTVSVAAT